MNVASFSFRKMVLAIIFLGIIGLIAELVLLEHYDSWTQWIPIVSLGAGLATASLVALRPSAASLRAFNIVMALFVAAGTLGLVLHFKGNAEWVLERDPELSGWTLIWKALRGATPALAPGALAQLGLLGLAWSYRHPAVESEKKAKETVQ